MIHFFICLAQFYVFDVLFEVFIVFVDTYILFTRTVKLGAHPTRLLIDGGGTCTGYSVGRMGKTKNE